VVRQLLVRADYHGDLVLNWTFSYLGSMPSELSAYAEYLLQQGLSTREVNEAIAKLRGEVAHNVELDAKPKTRPRPKGSGSVYRKGNYFWCSFKDGQGKRHQESTEQTQRTKAVEYLQKRMLEAAAGKVASPDVENAPVSQLVAIMFTRKRNEEIKGGKHADKEEARYTLHLEPWFGELPARKVTEGLLAQYISHRRAEKAENSTINREIAILQRTFSLAKLRWPDVGKLPEKNVRKGFLEDATRGRLLAECGKVGLWFRAMVCTAATFGFRKGELVNLRVCALDLAHNELRLERDETKTGEARQVTLTPEVKLLLEACIAGKPADALVFTTLSLSQIDVL
jgi:hypothetical protein